MDNRCYLLIEIITITEQLLGKMSTPIMLIIEVIYWGMNNLVRNYISYKDSVSLAKISRQRKTLVT